MFNFKGLFGVPFFMQIYKKKPFLKNENRNYNRTVKGQ